LAAELNEAEARPAKATIRANTRMAVFIFGNLSMRNLEGDCSPASMESLAEFVE
jgi:hypothetical protein